MRLDRLTFQEVGEYLEKADGIIIPTGSTEQHGPNGLIGTDTICAETIANGVAARLGAMVAPPLAYAPAPFNLDFPGTVSVPTELFEQLAESIVDSLGSQGFRSFYFLNGHGANITPLRRAACRHQSFNFRVRSWWEFTDVSKLRDQLYGEWEGMHATPSEISITQISERRVSSPDAEHPPARLPNGYLQSAAGDNHGPRDEHKALFPDGRVGAHSALASPEHGRILFAAAVSAISADYIDFTTLSRSTGTADI